MAGSHGDASDAQVAAMFGALRLSRRQAEIERLTIGHPAAAHVVSIRMLDPVYGREPFRRHFKKGDLLVRKNATQFGFRVPPCVHPDYFIPGVTLGKWEAVDLDESARVVNYQCAGRFVAKRKSERRRDLQKVAKGSGASPA